MTTPYEQNNYMEEHASDSAVLSYIQAARWDTSGVGTGDPQDGMWYYNTTANEHRYYRDGAWSTNSKRMEIIEIDYDDTTAGAYTLSQTDVILYVDCKATGEGDITLTIPDSGTLNDGSKILIYKQGFDTHTVVIQTTSSQNIIGATTQTIYKENEGLSIVSEAGTPSKWMKYFDNRSCIQTLVVASVGADFSNLEEAIVWANANAINPTRVWIKAGIYPVTDTMVVTNASVKSVEGMDAKSVIISPTFTAKPLFSVQNDCAIGDFTLAGTAGFYTTPGSVGIEVDGDQASIFSNILIAYCYTAINFKNGTKTGAAYNQTAIFKETITLDCIYGIQASGNYELRTTSARFGRCSQYSIDLAGDYDYLGSMLEVYGTTGTATENGIRAGGTGLARVFNSLLFNLVNTLTVKDTAVMDVVGGQIDNVTKTYVQADAAASLLISMTTADYTAANVSVVDATNIKVIAVDYAIKNDNYKLLVGTGAPGNQDVLMLNIGADDDNPVIGFDSNYFGYVGLTYRDSDAGNDAMFVTESAGSAELLAITSSSTEGAYFNLYYSETPGSFSGELRGWEVGASSDTDKDITFKFSSINFSGDPSYYSETGISVRGIGRYLELHQGVAYPYEVKTTNYTIAANGGDNVIYIDASSNDVAITLPSAGDVLGRLYTISAIDITNEATIATVSSQTINGVVGWTITDPYDSLQIQAMNDGTNDRWIII